MQHGAFLNQRYHLEDEIGRGGMGVVYRAHDTILERDVAVKVLSDTNLGTEGRGQLLREAQAVAQLNHPNIIAVYDAGEENGTTFIVMELLEGKSLYQYKPQSIAETLAIARQTCYALEHAHRNGIIHRDLKPENIFILEEASDSGSEMMSDVHIKLMDFGLARSIASRLTSSGAITGTVYYLAPELALGQGYDGRADLYALGIMLYELTTGRLPFEAEDPLAVISQHLYAPVVPPQTYNRQIPAALDALIVKLMSKQAEDRPASALQVGEALEQIEATGTQSAVSLPAASPLEQIVRGRLVGRANELSQLRQHWSQAMQGNGHLVMISGEPGVGKSRLADELVAFIRLRGSYVLQGGCYEYEATTPYLPLIEALRDWVDGQSDTVLRDTLGSTAAELAKLAPEIEGRIGPLPPNPLLPPEQERMRLFDAMARFLKTLTSQEGLLLLIDDLHWVEHGTLALLHYVLRRLRGERLLVLGAYREVELDRSHPLAASLVEWNRERLVTRIQLSRLTSQDCSRLLSSMFGLDQVSEEFVQAIYQETEGNPFFIEEVIKALIEQGQIYRDDSGWGRAEITELAIPQSIKEAIGRRLNKLEAEEIEALQYAGVLGKTFTFAEFLTGFEASKNGGAKLEDRLLDLLDHALEAQLIRAAKGEGFSFTHDKIREVLYDELNPVRRRRMHQRAGEGLERIYTGLAREAHIQDIAFHFLQSGDLPRALEYSRLAAQKAERLYAHEEAVRYYLHAAECAAALGTPDVLGEIYLKLGDVYVTQGLSYQAVERYLKALDLVNNARMRGSLKTRIGTEYIQVGDERGLAYLEEAQKELDPASQSIELALIQANLGRYHHYRAQHAKAIEFLERARELAEPSGDPESLRLIYGYLAGAYQHRAQFEESGRWANKCIELGKREAYPLATAIGYEFIAENSLTPGNWPVALEYSRMNRETGERIGDQSRLAWSGFPSAVALREQGKLEEALEMARKTYALAEEIEENRLKIWLMAILSFIYADLGEFDQASEAADQACVRADEIGQVVLQCWSRYSKASIHAILGEWQPAIELCEQGRRLYASGDNRISRLYIGAMAPQVLFSAGRLDEAQQWLAEFLSLARESKAAHYEAIGLRVEGQIYAAREMWERAEQAFEQASSQFRSLGSQLELGHTRYAAAQMWMDSGNLEAARESLQDALEIFTTSNARPWIERSQAAMQQLAAK
jgi:tetratricopeptide (TPR) repeat protein